MARSSFGGPGTAQRIRAAYSGASTDTGSTSPVLARILPVTTTEVTSPAAPARAGKEVPPHPKIVDRPGKGTPEGVVRAYANGAIVAVCTHVHLTKVSMAT